MIITKKHLYDENGLLTSFGKEMLKKIKKQVSGIVKEMTKNKCNPIDFERMVDQELTIQIVMENRKNINNKDMS